MTARVCLPVLLLSLAASGCGAAREPCTDGCPDISGVYSIQNAIPVGECAFSPYLVGPTVQLLQSDNGRRILLTVIDPALRMEVALTGEVYAPGPDDGAETLGSFEMNARTTRPASQSDERTVMLDVRLVGSVSRSEERRVLSATLSTADQAFGKGCRVTLGVVGEGS